MVDEHIVSDNYPSEGYVTVSEGKVNIHELVKTFLETKEEMIARRSSRERRESELARGIWVKEEARISLEKFGKSLNLAIECYNESIQYAVKLFYREPFDPCISQATFLRLDDDFIPPILTGSLDEMVPGLTLYYFRDSFDFSFLTLPSIKIKYLESSNGKYIQLRPDDLGSLATIGFIAIATDNTGPFLNHLITYIEKLLPYETSEVNLAGYDKLVHHCEQLLSNDNPLTMKRHILLAGPPGCGKSMIMKKIAQNHPEMIRCNLMKTTNWMTWLNLFSKIVDKCERKFLVLIDEIDELGLDRGKNGETVFELLRLLDGTVSSGNLMVLASTNRIEDLDPALTRPGRFGPVIHVDFPTKEQLHQIVDYFSDRYDLQLDSSALVESIDHPISGADIRLAIEDCIIRELEPTNANIVNKISEFTRDV